MQELRSQLDAEKKRSDELEEELDDREKEVAELRRNLSDQDKELEQLRSQLETERADRKQLEAEFSEKEQNPAPAATLSEKSTPDAATILSQLRARRKKSKVDLADLEAILEILES